MFHPEGYLYLRMIFSYFSRSGSPLSYRLTQFQLYRGLFLSLQLMLSEQHPPKLLSDEPTISIIFATCVMFQIKEYMLNRYLLTWFYIGKWTFILKIKVNILNIELTKKFKSKICSLVIKKLKQVKILNEMITDEFRSLLG